MKQAVLLLSTPVVVLFLAGCAGEPAKVAETKPCKVAPVAIGSLSGYGGPAKPVDHLDQEFARMQLQSTPYYRQQLQRRGYANNTVAEAVRDCY